VSRFLVRTIVSKCRTHLALVHQFTSTLILAKKFTTDHESVIYDSDTKIGTVTITNYAQASLGDVVFVELPVVGTEVKQGGKLL
jgi:glycine cleavage system H lipoate-binding protein